MKLLLLVLLLNIAHASTWNVIFIEDGIRVFGAKKEKGIIPFKATGIVEAKLEKTNKRMLNIAELLLMNFPSA
jgi:hypothetical protein